MNDAEKEWQAGTTSPASLSMTHENVAAAAMRWAEVYDRYQNGLATEQEMQEAEESRDMAGELMARAATPEKEGAE